MAEFTSPFVQRIAAGQNAVLLEDPVKSRCVNHRAGSGLVCVANRAIPTGGTVGAISLGLSLNGEVLQTSLATVTPAAVENFFNVSFEEIVCAGKCQVNLAITNPNTQAIEVENLTLIVEREC